MFNKSQIIEILQSLPFSKTDYWITSGAAMVIYGFKETTRDIDLGCSSVLADQLQSMGYLTKILDDNTRHIIYSPEIEFFENWIEGSLNTIDEMQIVSVDGLIKMKLALGRDKDLKDIEIIKSFLE